MKINIGSKNKVKIDAVAETLDDYKFMHPLEINSLKGQSEVSHQPKSLEETIIGARNRARNSFNECNYSFGIENGLIRVPYTKTGYMDICICAIYDGQNYHLGTSSAFEPPIEIVNLAIGKKLNLNRAARLSGLTNDYKIGSKEGVIGILTKNRVTRKCYTKQAIQMAMIHLENSELYKLNK